MVAISFVAIEPSYNIYEALWQSNPTVLSLLLAHQGLFQLAWT